MSEPQVDASASIEITVASTDLASALSSDPAHSFPPVFATSRMIAVMELASARLLQPHLEPGQLSVGVTVDITHSAATPPGALVKAHARYTGRDGKLFVFQVVAEDPGGEIGRGTHKRAIISAERLLSGAARRSGK